MCLKTKLLQEWEIPKDFKLRYLLGNSSHTSGPYDVDWLSTRTMWPLVKVMILSMAIKNIKGIHLYLPPQLWAEFLSLCEDISFIIWFSCPYCDSQLKGKRKNLQYIRVQIFSQILEILVVHSIQFFIFIAKI